MTPSRVDRCVPTSSGVIYELPRSQHHLVAPLFEDVWIDRALIDSVVEGTEPARVFAADPSSTMKYFSIIVAGRPGRSWWPAGGGLPKSRCSSLSLETEAHTAML